MVGGYFQPTAILDVDWRLRLGLDRATKQLRTPDLAIGRLIQLSQQE